MTSPPTIVFVEHVVWKPGDEWADALEHLATRFARVQPLDATAVMSSGPLHSQVQALEEWAADSGADLDRELGRWFDEHLSMHLRPNPATTRAVRAAAAAAPLHAASALPPRPAEAILRHAGCWRSVAQLHAGVRAADALAELVSGTGAATIVAAAPTPLPPSVAPATLGG